MKQIITALFILLLFSSCSEKKVKSSDQGVITYTISYPKEMMNNSLSTFLPGEMVSTFKNDDYKLHIKGDLNIYNLEYISRANGDSCFTLMKILDKKLFYPQKSGEKLFLFTNDDVHIKLIKDSTKEIAGYNCSMGIAQFANKKIPEIHFYYTEDINFKTPNANTPFKDVPGPLLEFNLFYQGMDLAFKAKSVKLKKVNDDEFIIPQNYRETNANEIKEIVSSLMQL
nr:hypothetical protein [uncultured Carboxylicivirga sp.]